mmetsp:Transcript_98660/g.254874  ORF Transcript_98660/g.254874 Transcript_98660/m.254874 type:complete len:336 (+) Transcript_98660:809-1816(+)
MRGASSPKKEWTMTFALSRFFKILPVKSPRRLMLRKLANFKPSKLLKPRWKPQNSKFMPASGRAIILQSMSKGPGKFTTRGMPNSFADSAPAMVAKSLTTTCGFSLLIASFVGSRMSSRRGRNGITLLAAFRLDHSSSSLIPISIGSQWAPMASICRVKWPACIAGAEIVTRWPSFLTASATFNIGIMCPCSPTQTHRTCSASAGAGTDDAAIARCAESAGPPLVAAAVAAAAAAAALSRRLWAAQVHAASAPAAMAQGLAPAQVWPGCPAPHQPAAWHPAAATVDAGRRRWARPSTSSARAARSQQHHRAEPQCFPPRNSGGHPGGGTAPPGTP